MGTSMKTLKKHFKKHGLKYQLWLLWGWLLVLLIWLIVFFNQKSFAIPPASKEAPSIIVQPIAQDVVLWDNVNFVVVAQWTEPLTYQWRFNESDIPGATNSTLMLSDIQLLQAGNYSVVVSNIYGSVVSNIVILNVINPDSDGDGILDTEDLCPNTLTSDTMTLKPNHFMFMSPLWVTNIGSKHQLRPASFTMIDTLGCSCEQILAKKPGNNEWELKYGCSKWTIDDFIQNRGRSK